MPNPNVPEVLALKPHHFLCMLGFEGKGYSAEFVENFSQIKEYLESEEGEDHPLRVTLQSDVICTPCLYKRRSVCRSQEKIKQLDEAHLAALSLQEEDILTWKEAKERIRQKITLEIFHTICSPCEWKKLGLCERALIKLLQERSSIS